MSEIRLPAGRSLRQVAEALGVETEALSRHANIDDPEAVTNVDRVVEVPDGFLRSRNHSHELQDAITRQTERKRGMNMWLAMDIEQKRTRVETALNRSATADDEDALREAENAFLRFECDSNDLAIELLKPLANRGRVLEVRARGAALLSLAQALRYLAFGAPARPTKEHALSAAKTAILGDPRMGRARAAMGVAMMIEPAKGDADEAIDELTQAVEESPGDGLNWALLADNLGKRQDLDAAHLAAEQAAQAEPEISYAYEAAGRIALLRGKPKRAIDRFQNALRVAPTNANANAQLALAYVAAGRAAAGRREQRIALDIATSDSHREWLKQQFERGSWHPR